MATIYPTSKQTFTDPVGTNTLDSPDHAGLHTDINDTVEAIEDTLGTTAGTSVLKNFSAGQFPVRNTGGGATGTLVHTLVGGTFNNNTLGTPAITGGTVNSAVLNNDTIGTPAITGGTITSTIINPVTSTTAKARAYRNAGQSINSGSITKITFNTENYDPGSNFDAVTNNVFTCPVTGYYHIVGGVQILSPTDGKLLQSYITRNGTIIARNSTTVGTSGQSISTQVSEIAQLTATDTVDIRFEHNEGTALTTSATSDTIFLAVHLLSI